MNPKNIEHPNPCPESLRQAADAWGRTWVEVDLAALRRNAERLAALLPAGAKLIVSAKKDAYGHGLFAVARALADLPFIGSIGVATVEEGIALRADGCTLPILCFSVLEGDALAEAIRQDLTLTITSQADAQDAAGAAAALGRAARAHLKLDTGMGRLGLTADEVLDQIPVLRALASLRLEGIYSHLADAWGDPASAREQCGRLYEFRRGAGLEDLLCHWGGSDALTLAELQDTARWPATWLRSGIALYGDHAALPELEPVMTFKSRVVYRRAVAAGTAISYGGTFRTARPTELALVGAGYGNGLLRALSGRGSVLLGGRRCPILGRVCMDQIVVDVTEIPEARMGDEAVIFGRQGAAILPAAEAAAQAGTISYELFCLAGQLNPRVYVG